MRSIFIIRKTDMIVFETHEYNFVIPRNVVFEINDIDYTISRTYFNAIDNEIRYILDQVIE
jgi:hypothetical protein